MSRRQRRVVEKRRRHARLTRRARTVGGLAVAATLLSGSVAHAATFTVTTTADSGPGSLRDAITQANATPAADTITFQSSVNGTLSLASALPQITEPLTITGPGAQLRIKAAAGAGIFSVGSNAPTEIDSVVLSGGSAPSGGAIDVTGTASPLVVQRDSFYNDVSTGSAASSGGGAVYAASGVTVNQSTFDGNSAAMGGGAILAHGGVSSIALSTFYKDTALHGGAVDELTASGSTITGSTIAQNSVSGTGNAGGGVYVASGDAATIDDSIVYGNSASTGSDVAVAAGGSVPTTAFSLFGTLSGSGITTAPSSDIVGQDPKLAAFQVTGGGLATVNPEPGSPAIDAGKAFGQTTDERGMARPVDLNGVPNAAGGDGSDIGAVELQLVTPAVSSLLQYTGAVGSTVTITGTGFTGATSVTFGSVSASFTEVSDTQITATVPPGSGTVPVTVTNPHASGSTTPSKGFSYPGAPLTVTTLADSGAGSLRDVVGQVNAGGAHEITFASGLSGAIDLASNLPEINNPVTIVGPGANKLTVDGGGKSSLFELYSSGPSSISGLTITGSHGNAGGGVFAVNGPLTLDADDITDNTAGFPGGGVAGGQVAITDSTISGNTAAHYGGGISSGYLTLIGSTVVGNAARTYGGGIWSGPATVIGSTITGNHVTSGHGGGIFSDGYYGSLTLEDSIVSGNTAPTDPDLAAQNAGTASFSLIGNTTGSDITPDGTDIVGKDPMLGPLQDNGGPTPTMLPAAGSPVLDAGKAFGVSTDQRGLGRTVDLPGVTNVAGGDGTDIGAVEVQVPLVSGVSPASALAGSSVTISGAGFTGASQVWFGGTPAAVFTVTSDASITATVPAGTGTVDVRVVGPDGESVVAAGDAFTYPTPTPSPTPTPTPSPTPTPTPSPTPKPPALSTLKAIFDDQQLVFTTPPASICTTSPATVSLSSTVIPGSKAKRATFLKASFYIGKGMKHTKRRKVHGKTRTVTTYSPNLVTKRASSTDRLTLAKGVQTVKVVVAYRTKVTKHHHVKTVTVTKTFTVKLDVC